MKSQSEADLQDHDLAVLESKKIHASSEVWSGSIRADIGTPAVAFAPRKVLERLSTRWR
jgi:hypothetical protein